MKKNIKQYLSKTVKTITPYQWEENVMEKALRFDTNALPFPPKSLFFFLKKMSKSCPINEYQDANCTRLKQLIAKYEEVKTDMITITNSGDEAIDILAKAFLNPEDLFIITPPTYIMFSIQCKINKGQALEIPLKSKKFGVDVEKIIEKSKNSKLKLIFLCNPNNPTGSVTTQEDIEKIVKNSQAIVVVDEVYREFYEKTVVPLIDKYKNLVVLRSFSKFAALAGARIGYLIADKFLSQKFENLRFPMGVSFLSYKLAEIVLEKDQKWIKKQIKMVKNERKRLTDELANLGFHIFPSQANFLLVAIGEKASEYCQRLKKKGIIIRDISKKKYLSGCVRITVRSPEENDWLLKALKEIV